MEYFFLIKEIKKTKTEKIEKRKLPYFPLFLFPIIQNKKNFKILHK